MSRSYDMAIELSGIKKEKRKQVREAVEKEWNVELFDFDGKDAFANGYGSLCGGESEEEFSQRLARAVWQANGGYCEVTVKATYLDELPYETYFFGPQEYKRIRRTKRV
jgi:hypothetical protein